MFPDAATSRGARHVAELAALTSERRIVLFVIQGAPAERFVPDIHTDPAFAVALRDAAVRGVEVVAVGTATTAEGITTITNPAVPVDFGPVASVDGDCGSYLLHMRLDEPRRVAIGALGEFDLEAGHYLYVGSAMGSLKSRTPGICGGANGCAGTSTTCGRRRTGRQCTRSTRKNGWSVLSRRRSGRRFPSRSPALARVTAPVEAICSSPPTTRAGIPPSSNGSFSFGTARHLGGNVGNGPSLAFAACGAFDRRGRIALKGIQWRKRTR
jgi:hypothetical protein